MATNASSQTLTGGCALATRCLRLCRQLLEQQPHYYSRLRGYDWSPVLLLHLPAGTPAVATAAADGGRLLRGSRSTTRVVLLALKTSPSVVGQIDASVDELAVEL
jgi:hypothetical protein